MICTVCGKEIRDDSLFCAHCGAKADEKAKEHAGNKKKIRKKSSKKPFIIGGIAVAMIAVIAVIVACRVLFTGRSIDKTIVKYMEAVREDDEELLLKIMFPKAARDDGEDWYEDREIDDILEDMNKKVKSISVVSSIAADEKISAMVEEIFDEADADIEYTELKFVNINVQYKKAFAKKQKEESHMLAYKVGNKWYILPGVFEYCVDTWQAEDKQSAETIATAIKTALAEEAVDKSFRPYYDVVIDLEDDLEYLPKSVQSSIMECLNSVPKIQHTYDGATGFSFAVSSYGEVTVYISTEANPTAWQVYPNVEEGYDLGVVDEAAKEETPVNPEYSYARLICEKSPILGYWQSDRAGMYIGYSTSGGNEGFTVYLQSQDFAGNSGLEILHAYNGYKYSGGAGNIIFSIDADTGASRYDIQIIDNDTIRLVVDNRREYNGNSVFEEYTFKREELTKERLSQYEGAWIDAGVVFSIDGNLGNIMEFAYCDECGSIHIKDCEENGYSDFYSEKPVSLYDGEVLHHIFPVKGLYDNDFDLVCYIEESYVIEGEMLTYSMHYHDNAGGGLTHSFFREGSEGVKVAEALNAYYQYIYENNIYYEGCELIYLDDDNIPELVYGLDYGCYEQLLTYYNGTVQRTSIDFGMANFSYSERTGKFELSGVNGSFSHHNYFEYKNGEVRQVGEAQACYIGEGIPDEYYIDGKLVDEATCMAYCSSFGDYEKNVKCEHYIIYEAYENLGVTEYEYSLCHIEAMSYDNGALHIKGDNGEEISYPVADDCVWEFEDSFSGVSQPITYELLESDWHDCRSDYQEYSEQLNYSVTAVVKDKQVVRVYTVHN